MPAKKKGKKKKGKKKAAEKPTNLYEVPPFLDPKIYTPKVTLKIRLASPVVDAFEFTLEIPITTRFEYVKQKIIERHGGSITDITMCLNSYTLE